MRRRHANGLLRPEDVVGVAFDTLHEGTAFWDESGTAWSKTSLSDAKTAMAPRRSRSFAGQTVMVTPTVAARPGRVEELQEDPDRGLYEAYRAEPERILIWLMRSVAEGPAERSTARDEIAKILALFEKYSGRRGLTAELSRPPANQAARDPTARQFQRMPAGRSGRPQPPPARP